MKSIRLSMVLSIAAISVASAELNLHWATMIVDSSGKIGAYSKPWYDKDGGLKVGYRGQYDVRYAEFKGGRWSSEIADTTSTGSAAKMDFVLDTDGHPHILYQNWNYQLQHYAAFDGTKWQHRQLDDLKHGNLDFYQLAMRPDTKGGVFMVYSKDRGPGNISALYGTRIDKDGNLSDTGYISPGNFGKWCSMAMDSKDQPVVAFFRHLGETLELAFKRDGAWQLDTIGKAMVPQPQGYHVSIARASDTLYHVTYMFKNTKELWMASGKPGGAWTTEKIDELGSGGFTLFTTQTSLGLGKDGIPFIAYAKLNAPDGQTVEASKLMLAYKDGDAWTKVVLDSAGIVGEYAALTISPEGTPAITYWDRTKNHLKVMFSSFNPITSVRRKSSLSARKGAPAVPRFDASGRQDPPQPSKDARRGAPGKILFNPPGSTVVP